MERERELAERPEIIHPHRRVPDFVLASDRCDIYDSRELVGKRPFVVVFFASWCTVCEHKMPMLYRTLDAHREDITTLLVSLDDTDAWAQTQTFLRRHGWPSAAVPGRDFVGFSIGYNPFRSVPVVVVVGRSGEVVDVQIGVKVGDEERLDEALDTAIGEPPAGTVFL